MPGRPRLRREWLAGVAAACLAACSGSGQIPPTARPTALPLHQLLRLPVATPTSCPAGAQGSASGRLSPWAGRVDVSVFLRAAATRRQQSAIRALLHRDDRVGTVFVETSNIAYKEYQRLYTCSADVPPQALPASYRIRLADGVELPARNSLVRRLMRLPGVASVSCDPSEPCTGITRERH